MNLDVQTLSVVTVFVTALLGALLLFASFQNRGMRSLMWWGGAHMIGALGLTLVALRGIIPNFLSIDLANAFMLFGYGMIWAGARVFDGRKINLVYMSIAPALWLLACRFPIFADDFSIRVIAGSTMLAVLAALTAEEFWRGRAEPLMSRWPTVVVLLADAAMLLARVPATLLSPVMQNDNVRSGVSFALVSFGTLLFTVVMAFLLLNMTKERTELKHKIASLVDPLSGVANRRAFIEGARRMLARQAVDREPLAMLLFDLDFFKQINDRFGHALGDRVLQVFADTATKTLGRDVLFGRIGGEEFAALIMVDDLGESFAVADRVRRNFAAIANRFGDETLTPSVSVGVTLGCDPHVEVDALLAGADRCLYRAKAQGRNRVEASLFDAGCDTPNIHAPSILPRIDEDTKHAVA